MKVVQALAIIVMLYFWWQPSFAVADDAGTLVREANGQDVSVSNNLASNTPAGGMALPEGIKIPPAFPTSYASYAEILRAVGDTDFSMDKCDPVNRGTQDIRVVRVSLSKSEFEDATIVNSLLLGAARAAWRLCPVTYAGVYGDALPGQYHYDVGQIDIYGPDGIRVFTGALGGVYGQGDGAYKHGDLYTWNNLKYVRPAETYRHVQEQQAAASQVARVTAIQAQRAEYRKLGKAAYATLFFSILAVIGICIWFNREALLGWCYSLTPHPATDMVEERISGGGELDGKLFAEIMRAVPGNRIEQRVRAEQAQRLAQAARAVAETRLEELQRLKTKAVQEVAYIRAQEDLRSAVETHELAMARLDALREWRRRNVERPTR